MAVFTELEEEQVQRLIERYDIGAFSSMKPIAQGIENTNYFLDTRQNGQNRRWILTLFETLDASELPYFCALTSHLAKAGLDVPAPVSDRRGEVIFQFKNKPGVIVPCLPGVAHEDPTESMCYRVGRWLGNMHKAGSTFTEVRSPPRGRAWKQEQSQLLWKYLKPEQKQLLDRFFNCFDKQYSLLSRCPMGLIHGDLFRDNVLFDGGRVSGVIDFYHACHRAWIFDLAVAVNDWATDAVGVTWSAKADAMLSGYQSVRPWTDDENASWPLWREVAAMQFWLSRLASKHLPGYQQQAVSGETIKDPVRMQAIVADMQSA